jgi:hypothetical protein
MVFRKRATPAPAFKQPGPFNPVTGQFAKIGHPGVVSSVVMMQIAEEDTHDNYVVCRGYDPETRKFYAQLHVAKPFGIRGTFPYQVGEVYPTVKAHGTPGSDTQGTLGVTPGVAADTTGQPADLIEVIEILLDDEEKVISHILLDAPRAASSSVIRYGIIRTAFNQGKSCLVEEREYQTVDGVKSLVCTGRTYRAWHPAGEYYGIVDEACVTWVVDDSGMTGDDLDDLGITLPDDADEPTETEIASIQTITCIGFVCECNAIPETSCYGNCQYKWTSDGESFYWHLWEGGCWGGDDDCWCPPPEEDGTEEGQVVTMFCEHGGTCQGICEYQWDGDSWNRLWTTCDGEDETCDCAAPEEDGTYVGQIVVVYCEGEPVT